MPIHVKNHKDGTKSINLSCDHCHKPLVKATKYGMFCEDGCGEAQAIEDGKKLEKMCEMLGKACENNTPDDFSSIIDTILTQNKLGIK